MHHIVATNFTKLSKEQLLFILQRRNHPEVRRWMAHPEPIAASDHLAYCATLKERPETATALTRPPAPLRLCRS